MKQQQLAAAVALLAAVAAFAGGDSPAPAIDAAAAFSQMKTLVGEWQADTSNGTTGITYALTAGGSVLVERESGPAMPEMMTVYHLDGKRLLMTHYRMAGNQPRMQAQAYDTAKGELQFRFLDATNLADPGAGHMHNANFRFVDHGRLISEWQFYESGRLKFKEAFEDTRVR